jgi:hypothetical protein
MTNKNFKIVAAIDPAPVFIEEDAGHAYCYRYGNMPLPPCLLKPASEIVSPVPPTPIPPTSTLIPPTVTPSPVPSTITPSPTPSKVTPVPTVPPMPTPQGPIMVNPGFESGIIGWEPFTLSGTPNSTIERLSLGAQSGMIYSGDASARWVRNWGCFRAGVRQTIAVAPGTHLRFTAHGRTWANDNTTGIDLSLPTRTDIDDGLSVGIDPAGGTDYRNSAIAWITEDAVERWATASVESAAIGNRVTVYAIINLGANGEPGQPGGACEWPLTTLAGWLDDLSIEVVP